MSPHPDRDLQRLLVEEPFVRALAHQLLASDADEVVQQTWLRAVQRGGRDVERPRHWLARIARNVAANLRRGDRRRRERDQAAALHELVPSSAELAQREEARRALVAAVDSLPPTLRTVVLLRFFDGLPPREIATLLGVEPRTVSTSVQRALELLRQRLDAAHGDDRRAWLLPLLPFAVRPTLPPPSTALPAAPFLVSGAITMMTKTKVAAAGAVLLLAAAYLGLPGWSAPLPPAPSGPTQQSLAAQQASLPVDAIADAEADAAVARQAVAPTPAAATTGALIAHVRYRDDRAPAVWSLLTLAPLQADTRYDSERQRTDDAGIARWQSLSPGSYRLGTLDGPGKLVDIAAGVTAEVAIELDPGMKIEGIVVDAAHAPVAGALVETEPMACVDALPEIAAVTGADGHFAARVQLPYVLVGARAAGFTAAPVQFLHGKQGNTAQVELVLGSGGGTVDGTVVDDAGRPIANATVIVGDGRVSGIGGHDHIPPFPAVTRSDAAGRFHAVGVPAGEQQLRARAPGFAPWTGTCEVAAGTSIESHIALDRGAVVRGTVTDSNARRLAGIEVVIGSWDDDLAFYRADSAADGTFELTGVPIGEVEVIAKDAEHGEARQRIKADASAPATCELRLSRGLELQGWVVDDAGQPVADAWLECYADIASGPWFTNVQSDARGHFVAINCPDTAGITIRVRGRGLEELEQRGVDPHTQDLRLRVRRTAPSTVRILGNVVGPDGRPVANADVRVRRLDAAGSGYSMATDNAGHFEFGPVPPGRWRLVVRIRDYPEFVGEARELGADATWDLGTIALARGGTARVHVLGEPAPHLSFLVSSDIGQRMSGVGDDGGTARTGALAAGDYHLLVDGDGIAATAVPFAIRAGEEVVVEVAPQPGVAQRFVCELPSGAQIDGVSLNVRRDDVVQAHVWADARPGQETAGQAWFAPGAYQLEAVAGELRGSATFTVGATAGPDVRVALH